MPTPLDKARKNLPDLKGMDDQRALRYLHNAYYSDLPIEEVAQKLGVKMPEPAADEKAAPEKAGVFRTAGDMVIKGAQGVVDLGASVVGLGNLATGGKVGEGMAAIGYDPQRTNEALGEYLSDSQKASDAAVQQAEGFTDTVVAAVQNPRSIAGSVAQSLPGMLAGGGVQAAIAKRVAGKAALSTAEGAAAAVGKTGAAAREAALGTTAGRQAADAAIEKATGSLVTVGAGIEGAQTAGNVAQQAQAEGRSFTEYAPGALAAGLGTAFIGKVAGKVAGDAATDVFAGTKSGLSGSLPARMAKAGFSEGVLEEMPQSAQEQYFTNVALGKDNPFEGVANAAGMGAVTGAAMGVGLGGFSGNAQPTKGDKLQAEADKVRRDEKLPEVGPLTAAANAETEAKARTIEGVADALKTAPNSDGTSASTAQAATNSVADDMQDAANTLVQQTGKASISHVQRHLKIGYNRAARMLEQMERDGLVSPAAQDGSRTVLEKQENQPQSLASNAQAATETVAPEIPVSDASAADQAAYDQATQPAADIMTASGTPFKNLMAARNRAKAEGEGFAAVPVDPANLDAGYVVRKQESTDGAASGAVLPAGAGTDAGGNNTAAGMGAGSGIQQPGATEQTGFADGGVVESGESGSGDTAAALKPRVEKGGRNLRNGAYNKNPLMTFLAQQGLSHTKGGKSLKSEFSPDKQLMVAGYGPVFRKNGRDLDELVQPAIEMGYLPADGTEQDLYALIQRAVGGEKISPQYAAGAEDDMQARYEARMRLEQDAAEEANNAPQMTEAEFYGLEQEIYDRMMLRTDDQLFTLDDEIPWDAPSNASTEDFLRALGAPEGEIKDAIAKEQTSAQGNDSNRAAAQEATTGAPQGTDGEGNGGTGSAKQPQPADEGLSAPTRDEVIAKQEREEQARKNAAAKRQADEKQAREEEERKRIAKASEAAADTFELGGDAMQNLTGQQDIFSAGEEEKPAATPADNAQAATDSVAKDEKGTAIERAKAVFEQYRPGTDQAIDPERYHPVSEDDNPKGLKIGDVVLIKGEEKRDKPGESWPDRISVVVSVKGDAPPAYEGGYMVKTLSGWTGIAYVEKTDKPMPTDERKTGDAEATQSANLDALFDEVLAEEIAKTEPAKSKKASKPRAAKAEKTEKSAPQPGTVGMKLEAGQVVTTLSGRETTPFPKFNGAKGLNARSLKLVDKWLMENALAEAESRGDDFNATQFRANLDKPQQADKDGAELYLFGEQPAVQPSILKPLGSAAKNTASGLSNTIDALGALFGGNPGQLNSGFVFNEDTYAKAKPLFKAAIKDFAAAGQDIKEAMRAVIRMVMEKFGAQAAQNMKPYIVRFMADVENGELEKDNAASSSTVLERDSEGRATEPAMVSTVSDESGAAERGTGEDAGRAGIQGDGSTGGPRLFDGSTAIAGERGDQLLPAGEQSAVTEDSTAGSDDSIGGSDSGLDGVSADPIPADAVAASADKPDDEKARRAEQLKAENTVQEPGLDNIRASLPYLLGPQQEDVFKAETRFEKPDGYGMLFTNGTGTGKTFTGLGVVKRMVLKGKENILIVVPDNKIAADWIDSGVPLGLTITQLEDTQTAGKGIVITTYANAGANLMLADRQWDMVVADEAHQLMQSEDGTVTAALETVRAITNHPGGFIQRHKMLNRELFEQRQQAADEYAAAEQQRSDADTPRDRFPAIEAKMQAAEAKLKAIDAKLTEKREAVREQVAASQGAGRTRGLFLSATPFAYEKTIDWANGYLFDYDEGRGDESRDFRGYNVGSNREQFFMQHFGYRMRYNKLTAPDAKVDTGMMQRQFNTMLKRAGSLSGRTLEVKPDYDRRFILTESAIGNRIDQALDWLRETAHEDYKNDKNEGMRAVEKLIAKQFNYLSRRYLLEAIKAQESIAIVKQHLALKRKVVVFHDYNKGGGFNPFNISDADVELGNAQAEQVADAVRRFKAEFKDLIKYPFSSFKSPISAYQEAFPDVLLINGLEKPGDLLQRYKKFQSDDTGPVVMLVQSDKNKGWSGHDTTGKYQRVLINLGQPTQPTKSIQQEGRIYRTGQASNAIFRYLNTGTNWERWAFASTIAQRSSAAENLGMGEAARALKDAYIAAFEESDTYEAGHEGEGTGGKERDRAANNALTEYDRAKAFYYGTQKKNSKTKAQEGKDYFATPEPVGLKMVEFLDMRAGEAGMEPSGGHGAIARWFADDTRLTVVEPSFNLRSRLALVVPENTNIVGGDFEELHIANKFDGIAMNPPFGVGGKTAIEHLAKAVQHLNDGGRIVALIPTGPAADKRFEKFMYDKTERKASPLYVHPEHGPIYKGDRLTISAFGRSTRIVLDKVDGTGAAKYVRDANTSPDGAVNANAIAAVEAGPRVELHEAAKNLYMVAEITLPQVTFERAGTSVATRIVVLEKQINPANVPNHGLNLDLSGIEDINELFDRMEDVRIPKRPKVDAPTVEEVAEKPKKPAVSAERAEAAQKQSKEVGDMVTLDGKDYPVVIYTTNAGKDIRGTWVPTRDIAAKYADRPFQKKPLGWFVRERDFPAAAAGEEAPVFSRRKADEVAPVSRAPEKTPLYEAFRQLSRFDETFQTGTSTATDLEQIAKDMTAKMSEELSADGPRLTAGPSTAMQKDKRVPTLALSIELKNGDKVKLLDIFDSKTDRPYVVIGNSEAGQGKGGATAYQIAFAWAHNNGKTMRPDPAGLTVINRLRRSEAMISSILHFGTDKHVEPHRDQYVALLEKVRKGGAEPDGTTEYSHPDVFMELDAIKSSQWKKGSTPDTIANNVNTLISASSQLAVHREPKIRAFEVAGGVLRLREDKQREIPLADMPLNEAAGEVRILGVVLRPAGSGVGSSTLKRAAVSYSVQRAIGRAKLDLRGRESGSSDRNVQQAALNAIRETLGKLDESAPQGLTGSLYSRADQGTGKGLGKAATTQIAEQIAARWDNAPEIIVAGSIQDTAVPEPVRQQDAEQRSQGAEGAPEGFFYQGKVYLIADQLSSLPDVVRVLFHESLGHYGLRGNFGKKLDDVLRQVAAMRPNDMKAKAEEYGLDLSKERERMIAAEEVLAEMAQNTPTLGFVKRAVAAIRQFLRELGLKLELTDADIIANYLLPARGWVERGSGAAAGPTRMSKGTGTNDVSPLGLYSALGRTVAAMDMKSGAPMAWQAALKGALNKGAIKADELEWSGLGDWLKLQDGKVTKEQVQAYLSANGVRVEEVQMVDDPAATGEQAFRDELGAMPLHQLEMRADDMNLVMDNLEGDREALIEAIIEDYRDNYDSDVSEETRYKNYTLPGGTNYREVLLTMPESDVYERDQFSLEAANAFKRQMREKYGDNWFLRATPEERRRNDELSDASSEAYAEARDTTYKSAHWTEPNVLAHIRLNDRTDADGKRVLFVEEIQSDWAQEGKKKGFKGVFPTEVLQAAIKGGMTEEQARADINDLMKDPFGTDSRPTGDKWKRLIDATESQGLDLNEVFHDRQREGLPAAPFVGKTDAWVALAIKRVITLAAQGGYDRVAFVNGDQSAERYDLSKQVDRLSYEPTAKGYYINVHANGSNIKNGDFTVSELEDIVGKEIVQKMLAGEGNSVTNPKAPDYEDLKDIRELSGDGLKVGGEGMKAFYNQIVPKVAKEVLRKTGGGELKTFGIPNSQRDTGPIMGMMVMDWMGIPDEKQSEYWRNLTDAEREQKMEDYRNRKGPAVLQQLGFDMTPALKDAAGAGLPMFSRAQMPPSDAGDIARSADFQGKVRDYMADLSRTTKKVNWWERTVGTQYAKAERNADFKQVFDATQAYISSTSAFANNAAHMAKDILPQLESLADLGKKWLSDADRKAIARPIFEGTLSWARDEDGELVEADDVATAGVVFTPAELKSEFGLNDQQVKLYQQFRAAVDKSLSDTVVTDALRYLGKTIPADLKRLAVDEPEIVRQAITKLLKDKADETGKEWMDAQRDMRTTLRRFDKQLTKIQQMTRPMEKANAKAKYEAERETLEQELQDRVDTAKAERDRAMRDQLVVGGKFDKIDSLKARGYSPLTRFGKFHVTVTNKDTGAVDFFGLFETEREANKAARELAGEGNVSQGILSEQSYKLFSGVNPETLEIMGEAMGVEDKAMFEAYIKMTKNQRSTMKRLLKRKGVPGFSEDVTRVLASFLTGNARASSANLHLGDATRAASNIKAGDVKDEAVKLVEYVKNPQEEAQAIRGLLFAQFLGGSVASALVNMTQPFTMTLPYLSQFSNPAKAAVRLTAAMKSAVSPIDPKTEIGKALNRAEADGIVSPQEIHQLQAEVTKSSSYNRVLRKAGFVWGSLFSLAEQFNRRTTFIAAYEQAKADGNANPYEFATKAVEETQGIYNKANKPNWARGAVGGVVFTFKQYSISYLEFLTRLPRREQVFALALLMLAAGAEGLPFADDLDDLIDTLGQKLGYNWNSKREKREFLTETIGMSPEFANLLLRGGSAIPGVPLDVSSRMGMANLIPGTGLLLEHKKDKAQDVLEFIGPAGSVAQQAVAGMGKALEGDVLGAGKEVLPVAMQNALKGADMLQTGMYRDRGGRKVTDTTEGEAFIKGMGFQPRTVADTQMRTRIVSQDNELAKAKESQFAQKWAEARFEGDQEAEDKVREQIRNWNERNPEAKIRINMADIAKRVRNMKQDKVQRTIKQATPEMRAYTRETLQ